MIVTITEKERRFLSRRIAATTKAEAIEVGVTDKEVLAIWHKLQE